MRHGYSRTFVSPVRHASRSTRCRSAGLARRHTPGRSRSRALEHLAGHRRCPRRRGGPATGSVLGLAGPTTPDGPAGTSPCRRGTRAIGPRAGRRLDLPLPQGPPEPSGRPAPPGGRRVGRGTFRGTSSALCWPEAGRGGTSRGRRRASSASARRPSRARTRGRNRPRRPARDRVRDPTCRNPARLARVQRSALAGSRRAARRVLARSAVRVVRRCRFRGRDPSRQKRVSRDRRPARGPRRSRIRSPGLVGPRAAPNRRDPRFEQILCEVPRSQDVCRQRLECATPHNSTPQHRLPPRRASNVRALPRSSAAPRCRSAASPP